MTEPGPQAQGILTPPPPQAQAGQQAPKQQEQHVQHVQQGKQIIHFTWSHIKPKFLGKPEEDAEVHLFCTNAWMNVHHFVEGVKTLLGEARLWYQSLEPIHIDW